jgi:hypothetical protein
MFQTKMEHDQRNKMQQQVNQMMGTKMAELGIPNVSGAALDANRAKQPVKIDVILIIYI